MSEWNKNAPGWEGFDVKADFLMASGQVKRGEFDLEESCSDGEWSAPVWFVLFEDGTRVSFYDNCIAGWQKVSE